MKQILILTKNVLAEQQIQQKLQHLDYEVYCSSAILSFFAEQETPPNLFMYFQFVILSETLAEEEVANLIPLLRNYPINILRKFDKQITERERKYLEKKQLNAMISTEFSVDDLRECFYRLQALPECPSTSLEDQKGAQHRSAVNSVFPYYQNKDRSEHQRLSGTVQRLTPKEAKVLRILIHSDGKIIDREEMCREVWDEEISNSNKVSLSSTISRIKDKFNQDDIVDEAIHTVWGKGYRLNFELLDKIKQDERVSNFLSIA